MWIISRNSKKEFLLEANYKEQGLLMDSNVNVGSNRVFKDPSELNAQDYDVINYPDTAGKQQKKGFCESISQAFKAVYQAPTCVKVMGALGVLCLAGSAISAYQAFTAMQTKCKLMDAPKPTNPSTTSPSQASHPEFEEVFPKLPVVILTSQKTKIEARGNSTNHTNRCEINDRLIGGSSSERCRIAFTGQPIDVECRQTKFDLRADVTRHPMNCELSEMSIKKVYTKKFGLLETCSIYDSTGVNTEENSGVRCVNLPKTPAEARDALFQLGQEIGERLKASPNFKDNVMGESVSAFQEIQEMANAYDEYALDFNLGHSLKGGFFKAMRGNDSRIDDLPFMQEPTTLPTTSSTNGTSTERPKIEVCTTKVDGHKHATHTNLACSLGAIGVIMLGGCLLTAELEKSDVTVRVGVPKNDSDAMVLSYNGVTHHYNMREASFSPNFNHDLANLVKFLLDKGENVGEVYELALEVCDKVDMRTGTTKYGDSAMNVVRCFLRENYEQSFTKYLIAMGIEDPENKTGECWLSSIFSWGNSQTPSSSSHQRVPQVARAVQENTDEPVYAGIPMHFIRSSGATTPPLGASTPHTQVRAQIVGTEERYSMGEISEDGMDLGDLTKGFSVSTNSLTDGTYRYDLKD